MYRRKEQSRHRFMLFHPFSKVQSAYSLGKGQQKSPCPKSTWDKSVTPAVPPEFIRITRIHFFRAPLMHAPLITGGDPVAPNPHARIRIALVSPFNTAAAAAIPPSAALFKRLKHCLLLLLIGFADRFVLIICDCKGFVNREF